MLSYAVKTSAIRIQQLRGLVKGFAEKNALRRTERGRE